MSVSSLNKNGSNVNVSKMENQDQAQCFSITELTKLESKALSAMSFEITKDGESHGFIQLRKKIYNKGSEQRMLIQLIDISNQIMYE